MNNKLTERGYWLISAVLGSLITLRAILGPDAPPFHLRSPTDTQSCLGLAFVLALAAGARLGREWEDFRRPPLVRPICLGILALILLTAAAYWRTTGFYFLSDDFVLVKAGNSLRSSLRTAFAAEIGYGFYRPITRLSLALDSTWAQWDPVAWHLSALALHLANSFLVFMLALRLCTSRIAAFFAAALFSIHATRPETVVWIAGRFDLLATFFVLCGLLCFIKSIDLTGPARFLYGALALLCMCLAILSKESAYIFPLLLVLFLAYERHPLRERIGSVIPYFLVAAGLFSHRLILYGGIGGYRNPQVGGAGSLMSDVFVALKVVLLRIWGALFFPLNWSIEPGVLVAIVMAGYMIALIRLAASGILRRQLAFALGFVLVGAIPPLQWLLIGSDLVKSRFLYLPSIGFCLMLALAAERLRGRSRWIAPTVILLFNLVALEHNLKAWRYASDKVRSAAAAAMGCVEPSTKKLVVVGLPATLRGVYFWGNGFPECVEMQPNGAAVSVVLLEENKPSSEGVGTRRLVWDRSADELRCVEPR